MRRPIETNVAIVDETARQFIEDGDTDTTLDLFARGFITAKDLSERLEFLLTQARERAERTILGAQRPDDAEARIGTWDDTDADEQRRNFQADQMEDSGGDAA
jgi:hypothetical protein